MSDKQIENKILVIGLVIVSLGIISILVGGISISNIIS